MIQNAKMFKAKLAVAKVWVCYERMHPSFERSFWIASPGVLAFISISVRFGTACVALQD